MSITQLARPFLMRRAKEIEKRSLNTEEVQRSVLSALVARAEQTQWGREYGYDSVGSYETFAGRVPVNTYEELKNHIDLMRQGEADVLWPGRVRWYAKSSGTTNDKSKFIPVSADGLRDTHYAGGRDAVALYLRNHPKSKIFDGRALILGGSHAPNYNLPHSLVGDLSAILIENINPVVNLIRVPKKSTALLADFEEKRDRIAREALNKNVTNLSGVPSWMMSVISRVLELSGKDTLEQVWPNLEVFFHGGVAFTPYREQYRRIIRSPKMNYMETYNASEGFFGLQSDPDDSSMLLMTDYGVFYEFIPLEEVGKPNPHVIPLWQVECGRNYAIVISTSSGLWRYQIGDTVRFTSTRPYKFVISGRTKCFINAFGEELIVDNAEQGLRSLRSHRCRGERVYRRAGIHERRGTLPPPMGHRVRYTAGRSRSLCRPAGPSVAKHQLRLRSQALQEPHAATPRDYSGTRRPLRRLVAQPRKTGRTAQGATTEQQPQEH